MMIDDHIMCNLDRCTSLRERSFMHRLNPRVKTLCAFITIFGIVMLSHYYVALSISVMCLLLALLAKISLKRYISMLIYPLISASFIVAIMSITVGSQVLWNIGIPIYEEGFLLGMLIFSRVISAVSVLILLVSTTPIASVMNTLKWLKIPTIIVNTAALMLRYFFVFGNEGARIFKAQKSRGGYAKSLRYVERIRNYGIMGGMLLIRSYTRAENIYKAMLSRGYREDSQIIGANKILLKDGIVALLIIFGIVLLISVDYFYLGRFAW